MRTTRVHDSHVTVLNGLVEEMHAAGSAAPWVDPVSGGVKSRVLFLLESPGPRASSAYGSGFVSPDNDDQTAERFWRASVDAGLDRATFLNWNVVPWYIGISAKNENARRRDWPNAEPWLHRFVELLPELRVVVAMGNFALDCWLLYQRRDDAPVLPLVPSPHPSVQARRGRPNFEAELLSAMGKAANVAAKPSS